jgi:RHH-type transcriptional regulator, proline utilization regulon repressor / proline dehydrogenase / delta 1-pyrroline-5-carboxylate dehydrogenase
MISPMTAHRPLGPVVCISPWNFPLAIFTGQIAAALAAGNSVLAKPAEQTPLIAAQAVRILHGSRHSARRAATAAGQGESVGRFW